MASAYPPKYDRMVGMNKFHFALTFIIIAIFVSIIVITQSDTSTKNITQVPTLPPEASTFKMATSAAQRQQQQQVAGQQTQQEAPVFGVEEGVKASYSATIKTSKGDIEVVLLGSDAPNTVKNFIKKAEDDYYKNLVFHRVEDWVLQGGDPNGDGTGGNLVQTEVNALPFEVGTLGVAGITHPENGAIISNDSQFFITKTEAPWLNQKYTNFGYVTDGMDVVNSMKKGDKILGIVVEE